MQRVVKRFRGYFVMSAVESILRMTNEKVPQFGQSFYFFHQNEELETHMTGKFMTALMINLNEFEIIKPQNGHGPVFWSRFIPGVLFNLKGTQRCLLQFCNFVTLLCKTTKPNQSYVKFLKSRDILLAGTV